MRFSRGILTPVFHPFFSKNSKREFIAIISEFIDITSEIIGITSEDMRITSEVIAINGEVIGITSEGMFVCGKRNGRKPLGANGQTKYSKV